MSMLDHLFELLELPLDDKYWPTVGWIYSFTVKPVFNPKWQAEREAADRRAMERRKNAS